MGAARFQNPLQDRRDGMDRHVKFPKGIRRNTNIIALSISIGLAYSMCCTSEPVVWITWPSLLQTWPSLLQTWPSLLQTWPSLVQTWRLLYTLSATSTHGDIHPVLVPFAFLSVIRCSPRARP
ncbi:unnamed protein product, partial [Aureobasidium pullulans]